MIAEIYGKISSVGSNLSERLEDNLTGNIFGNLRYLPYDLVLGPILKNSVFPTTLSEYIQTNHVGFWNDKIKFWPYNKLGELDVIIEFDDLIIGIEVKYQSDLSSDDGKSRIDDFGDAQLDSEILFSVHQLHRESKILLQKDNYKRKVLLFIAKSDSCRKVYEDTVERGMIENGVAFGYISWETFLDQLNKLKLENPFYDLLVSDLVGLLKRKGFESFKNMILVNNFSIDSNDYFNFNESVQDKFSFNQNWNFIVKGDMHYEFR